MEHYAAQQFEAGDERKNDLREVEQPIIEENQDIKKNETMNTVVEKFQIVHTGQDECAGGWRGIDSVGRSGGEAEQQE